MKTTTVLPVHLSTGLTALGVLPSGRVVWPIMGGSGDGGQPQGQPAPATGPPAQPQPPAPTPAVPPTPAPPAQQPATGTAPAAGERGYPEGTPVAEMTTEQQLAYWRYHSRQHEDRWKALDVTAEELARLRQSDAEMQRLAEASRTDMERVEARAVTAEQRLAAVEPELLKLRAAIEKGLPGDVGTKLLAAARRIVGATADELAADAADYFGGSPIQLAAPAAPALPAMDQGTRQTGKQTPSVAAGRDLYAERHGSKTTT